MSDADKLAELSVDIKVEMGQLDREFARLTKEIDKEEIALRKVTDSLKNLNVAQVAQNPLVIQHAQRIATLNLELSHNEKANERLRTSAGLAAGQTRNLGSAALYASQAFEDAQYGLNGVLNNIPQVIQAFGGPAGLAAGISVAAVGINILINNWDKLAAAFGASKTKTEAEAMEELAKATERTAAETEKLNKYKERQATIATMAGSKTEAETNQSDVVNKVVADAGIKAVKKGLIESAGGMLSDTDPESRTARTLMEARERQIRATEGNHFVSRGGSGGGFSTERVVKTKAEVERELATDPELAKLRTSMAAKIATAADNMLAEATTSPEKLKALMNAVAASPGSFPKDFGKRLAAASPEELEAKRLNDEDLKQQKDSIAVDRHNAGLTEKVFQQRVGLAEQGGSNIALDLAKQGGTDSGSIVSSITDRLLKSGQEKDPDAAKAIAEQVVTNATKKFSDAAQALVVSGKAKNIPEATRMIGLDLALADAEKKKAEIAKLTDDFKPKVSDIGSYLNSLQTAGTKSPAMEAAEKQIAELKAAQLKRVEILALAKSIDGKVGTKFR